jgi:hypothetical protein
MLACLRRRYDTLNTNSLRLWSAMPDTEIDLSKFNEGEYGTALAARQRALEITQVTRATAAANYAHTYTFTYIRALWQVRSSSFFSSSRFIREVTKGLLETLRGTNNLSRYWRRCSLLFTWCVLVRALCYICVCACMICLVL